MEGVDFASGCKKGVEEQVTLEKNTRREIVVWRKLAFGWWKREETAISGTGWVIKNNSGWFQLGGGRGRVRATSSLAIESMVMREALWAYIEKGASNCGV
ncbi:hypothetical protein DVH24_042212 [Malus domestica]|uniref:Uncharacterized protein n=1 Tax=Malus domestica TaxID=3750 RepID=A0A498J3V9_MALDO|nr:hypothetical protein DVH24_042212 [Malus domestica]